MTALRFYALLVVKSYRRNLQYRAGHMINNLGSAIFGFVFIAIWQAVGVESRPGDAYNAMNLTWYVGFNQAILWISTFHPLGLDIPTAVRTGAVATDLMRPVGYFPSVMSRGAGNVLYNVVYRTLPLIVIYAITTGLRMPASVVQLLWLVVVCILAGYMGLLLEYLKGLTAFWTTEIRWLHMSMLTLSFLLAGYFMPLDFLPGPLARVARLTPFAALSYYPGVVYLGLGSRDAILVPLLWSIALTILALWGTARARRRVEVQGG